MPRLRLRISILTTLLLMTIISMAFAIGIMWRDLNPLRLEVRKLRRELGYLTIVDKDKIYAIQVPTDAPDTWRYRIYIPENQGLLMHTRIFTIPGRSPAQTKAAWFATLPGSGSSWQAKAGEYTLEIKMRRPDPNKDNWDMVVNSQDIGGGTTGSEMPWLNDHRAWTYSSDASTSDQIEADPEVGLVLFELHQGVVKEFKGGYSRTEADTTKEVPGVMFWIAPPAPND
jgi:hypothetical protein